jgi:hypothetical protein
MEVSLTLPLLWLAARGSHRGRGRAAAPALLLLPCALLIRRVNEIEADFGILIKRHLPSHTELMHPVNIPFHCITRDGRISYI